ncbi:hypothetical protein JCM12681A_04870 [Streptomyces mexicanus]
MLEPSTVVTRIHRPVRLETRTGAETWPRSKIVDFLTVEGRGTPVRCTAKDAGPPQRLRPVGSRRSGRQGPPGRPDP